MPGSPAPKQWEVWKVRLRDGIKREQTLEHYALVVSANAVNANGVAMVAPITTTGSSHPWVVEVEPADAGIEQRSFIECNQLQTLACSPQRFLRCQRKLAEEKRPLVALALAQALRGALPSPAGPAAPLVSLAPLSIAPPSPLPAGAAKKTAPRMRPIDEP